MTIKMKGNGVVKIVILSGELSFKQNEIQDMAFIALI